MSGRGRSVPGGRRSRPAQLLGAAAALSVLVHLFGLYRPTGPPTPSWFPSADKLEHLVGFGAPVCLVLLALAFRRSDGLGNPARTTALVTGLFALHAVVSELAQHFFYVHRTGDPRDVLADWLGVLLGAVAAELVLRRRRTRAALREAPLQVRE
jgi:VanZ family protein